MAVHAHLSWISGSHHLILFSFSRHVVGSLPRSKIPQIELWLRRRVRVGKRGRELRRGGRDLEPAIRVFKRTGSARIVTSSRIIPSKHRAMTSLAELAGYKNGEASIIFEGGRQRYSLGMWVWGLTPPHVLDLVLKRHPSTASWPSFADLTASHLQAMLALLSFPSHINLREV